MKQRIEDLDFIKGIMIFLMVCFHINVGQLKNITDWIYSFHMPVFLFYSGYFVSLSKPISERLYTLLRSLIVPFVFFEIIYILILFVAGKIGFNFSNSIENLDVSIFFYRLCINPIGAYWYLHTLIICLLILFAIEYFNIKNDTSVIIIIGLCFFILSFYIEGFKFENSFFFVLGYFFKIFAYDVYASILSFLCIIIIFLYGDNSRASISSIGTTFFVISFLKYIYNKIYEVILVKYFVYLGKNTLIIVVLHPIFLNLFKLLEKWFLKIDSTLIMYSLLNTSFTICLSLITAVIFDKISISNLLFGKKIYVPYKTLKNAIN